MDIPETLVYWHWLIAALGLGILELVLPGIIFIWLGLSAGIIGLLLMLFPAIPVGLQLSIFVGFALLSVILARYFFKRSNQTSSDHPLLNQRGSQYIGKTFPLIEDSENMAGKVRIADSEWSVELNTNLPAGSSVLITGAQGNTLTGEEA